MVGRRDALAGIGATVVSGLAGCIGLLGGSGDGGGNTTLPSPDPPAFDGPTWSSAGGGPRNRGTAVGGTGPEDSGRLTWTTSIGGLSMYGPVVAGNTVFYGDIGVLEAVAAADGSTRWTRDFSKANTPTFANGSLYVPHSDDGLVAVDPASGDTTWRFDASGASGASSTSGSFSPTTVVVDGVLYAVTREGDVLVLDEATREEQWRLGASSVNTIGVADGVVYARTTSGVAAVSENTVEWNTGLPETGSDPLIVGDDNVYARGIDSGGTVYAVDRSSGERQWTYQAGGDLYAPGVAYGSDRVAFAAGSTVAVIDPASGDPVWEQSVEGAGGVAVGGDTVYATLGEGTLAAYALASGEESWRVSADVTPPVASANQPMVVGDRVYAPFGTTLAAIDPA